MTPGVFIGSAACTTPVTRRYDPTDQTADMMKRLPYTHRAIHRGSAPDASRP